MSPELGVANARGEVGEHHHRRKERHDPLIAESEGGNASIVDDCRTDQLAEPRPVEPGGLRIGLMLEESGCDRVSRPLFTPLRLEHGPFARRVDQSVSSLTERVCDLLAGAQLHRGESVTASSTPHVNGHEEVLVFGQGKVPTHMAV